MLFDNRIDMSAISAVRQFNIAQAISISTVVKQNIVRFDICHQESVVVS